MNDFVDHARSYNRYLRIHRFKKKFAVVGMCVAALVLALGFGIQVASIGTPSWLVALFLTAVIVWGVWGFLFITKRH